MDNACDTWAFRNFDVLYKSLVRFVDYEHLYY